MDINTYLENSEDSASTLAKKIGVAPAMIYQWRTGIRRVPVRRCIDIEQATNGKVSRRDLRPDDWHLIWPELAVAETEA